MKKYSKYNETKPYSEQERLPIGGYLLKIMEAKEITYQWGRVLVISFDIAEGEYKDFYMTNYKNQTQEDKKWKGTIRINVPDDEDASQYAESTARRFRTIMDNIEESNPGYHWDWDETKLKGKKIGGLFRNKEYEYEGRTGFFTECCSLITVDRIKSGKFDIPKDKLLNKKQDLFSNPAGEDGFINIPDGIDEELPFN